MTQTEIEVALERYHNEIGSLKHRMDEVEQIVDAVHSLAQQMVAQTAEIRHLSEKVKNEVIPVACGCAGAALGVAGMFIMPDFPAQDVINAAAIGIVSGLAATGINQAAKQLRK